MSPAIPVWIGHRRYAKKSDAEQACRDIVNKYPGQDQPIGPITAQGYPQLVDDPDDIAFLHDLVKLHTTSDQVIGTGVKHFLVRVNGFGFNAQRCFWVWRNDDSYDDFSWRECLKNAPTKPPNGQGA